MRQKGHLVIVVQPLDPAELHFDFSQTLELSGMETDKTFLVDPITLKNAYQKVVKEKKDQLNDFCMKQNILFEQVSTVTNIAVIIRKIVQRISSFRSVNR